MLRTTLLSCLVLVGLFGSAPASARAWSPPPGTQIMAAGRFLPPPAETRRWVARLKGFPMVVEALDWLRREGKVDLEEDLLSWLEGEGVVAQVRLGEASPLSELARRSQREEAFQAARARVVNLVWALNMFHEASGRLPEELSELDSEDSDADPDPDLSQFHYEPGEGGTFRIELPFPPGSPLAGQPPLSGSEGGVEARPAPFEVEPARLDTFLALSVQDQARARVRIERLRRILELPRPEQGGPTVEIRDGWAVFTDNPALVGPALEALAGRVPPHPSYERVRAGLSIKPDRFVFADLGDLLEHWQEPDPALASLKGLGAFITAVQAGPERLLSDSFLEVRAVDRGPLLAALTGPEDTAVASARVQPWSVSSIQVVHVKTALELLDGVSEAHPALRMGMSLLRGRIEQELGLSLDRDLLPAASGEVTVSFELVDWVGAALQASRSRAWPKDEARALEAPPLDRLHEEPSEEVDVEEPPQEEPSEEVDVEEPPDAEYPDPRGQLRRVPFTLSFTLQPGPTRERFLGFLERALGPAPVVEVHQGRTVRRAADLGLSWVAQGDRIWVVAGPSLRLLQAELACSPAASLDRLDSFRAFQRGIRGRLVYFAHGKVDALYSLAKGALLMLGAELRPEAERLGRWRDSYLALTLEPGGVRLRGAVYAAEDRP